MQEMTALQVCNVCRWTAGQALKAIVLPALCTCDLLAVPGLFGCR
jgi:hypothetical protein